MSCGQKTGGSAKKEALTLKIGLIGVDGHNWPNLALMKISAYHKNCGDIVEWWDGWGCYDRVYMSRVFTDLYSPDVPEPYNASEIVKGGTGYDLAAKLDNTIEHQYPDYSLYPQYTRDTAYGYLTRGCPRNCGFCIVAEKEGRHSYQAAELSEFWRGQRYIKLLDPNLLACPDHERLLISLADSGARVDFTQGLDIRLTTPDNIALLRKIKIEKMHFAWDNPDDDLIPAFKRFASLAGINKHRRPGVYVLTNYNTSLEQDLYRIYALRGLGYDPYVMIYDKPHAPQKIRYLQRWCNNPKIINSQPNFKKYNHKMG